MPNTHHWDVKSNTHHWNVKLTSLNCKITWSVSWYSVAVSHSGAWWSHLYQWSNKVHKQQANISHWHWLQILLGNDDVELPWVITAVPSNNRCWRTPAVNSPMKKCWIFWLQKSCLGQVLQQLSLVAAFLLEEHFALPTSGLFHQDEALGSEQGGSLWHPHLHPTFPLLNPWLLLLLPLPCSAPPPLHFQTGGSGDGRRLILVNAMVSRMPWWWAPRSMVQCWSSLIKRKIASQSYIYAAHLSGFFAFSDITHLFAYSSIIRVQLHIL